MNRTWLSACSMLVLVCGSAAADISLGQTTSLPAPQRPSGVATGDFNGDGQVDLAVTTDTPDKITVFPGNGAGGFGAGVNHPTGAGSGPQDITAVDFDADGDLDLAVVLQNAGVLRVFVNSGGTFTGGASVAIGDQARGLAAADLDADGDTDFAVANRNDNTVTLVYDQGLTLSAAVLTAGGEPRVVTAGDLTGDGVIDLAVTNHDDRNATIYRGAGGGAFVFHSTVSTGANTRPEGIAAGDLDADGDLDLAVTTNSGTTLNFVTVLRNLGGGSFSGPVNFTTGGVNPGSVKLADLDADGDLDAVAANQDSGTIGVLTNTGAASFAAPQVVSTGATPDGMAVANLFGELTAEIVVANRDANTVTVTENLSAGFCPSDFDQSGFVDTDDFTAFVVAFEAGTDNADIDGSGFVDTDDFDTFVRFFEAGC
ncbi:MAG: hypothetical protein AMXMBFR58_16910 [Phycisphaerae bacterium]